MTTVAKAFAAARAENRGVLVGYLPAGFPTVPGAIDAMLAMVDAGVDVIEVGVPYSDPLMDGPTIQAAAEAALRNGFRLRDVFGTVEAVAATGIAPLVMTYWNPVERYGVEPFARALADAGGAGLITPDLIPDEAAEWISAADAHDLDKVFLVAPSSTDARIRTTVDACRGFVYATAVMGVTGARDQTSSAAPALVARVRRAGTIPVGVGVGVSNAAQATEVAGFADAVIVGSALVRCLLDAESPAAGVAAVHALTSALAAGVRDR
jgi:tryptophan synthase alpha chain